MNYYLWGVRKGREGRVKLSLDEDVNTFGCLFEGKGIDIWSPKNKVININIKNVGSLDSIDTIDYVKVISERARAILNPMVGEYIQCLPVDLEKSKSMFKLWIINSLCLADCIDLRRTPHEKSYIDSSQIELTEGDETLVLKRELVPNIPIFRLSGFVLFTIVSEAFVALLMDSGCKGFEFSKVKVS